MFSCDSPFQEYVTIDRDEGGPEGNNAEMQVEVGVSSAGMAVVVPWREQWRMAYRGSGAVSPMTKRCRNWQRMWGAPLSAHWP